MDEVLVNIKGVRKYYPVEKGLFAREPDYVKAVDGVDLVIPRGETLGLVGESGCGKSTLGRLILRLEEPTEGQVCIEGQNIVDLKKEALRNFRKEVQVIFQDPYSSLNPRKTVGKIVEEPFLIHGIGNRTEREERVKQ